MQTLSYSRFEFETPNTNIPPRLMANIRNVLARNNHKLRNADILISATQHEANAPEGILTIEIELAKGAIELTNGKINPLQREVLNDYFLAALAESGIFARPPKAQLRTRQPAKAL